MRYFVTIEGDVTPASDDQAPDGAIEVVVTPEGLSVDGEPVEARLLSIEGTDAHRLEIGHASHRISARRGAQSGVWSLHLDGLAAEVEVVDERTRVIRALARAAAGSSGPRPVRAPMPGLVVRIEVAEGDVVQPGQGVAIVEAMKMENELRAEAEGRVTRIAVKTGDTVNKDQVLIELAALDEGEEA